MVPEAAHQGVPPMRPAYPRSLVNTGVIADYSLRQKGVVPLQALLGDSDAAPP